MDGVAAALNRYGQKVEAEVAKAVEATALLTRTDIQTRIQRGPKTGRIYRRGNILHQASAPGQAPATDTGFLVASIDYTKQDKLTAVVGSRLVYAAYLEFGTMKMAPRPAWRPAVEKMKPEFERRIREALRRANR